MNPLVWLHSSMSDLANVRMSTRPHDSAAFGGSVLAARSKYLSPLSISFASEATLNARIDWRRPKLARCDDVNLDDSVTAPETSKSQSCDDSTTWPLLFTLTTCVAKSYCLWPLPPFSQR